MRSIRRGSRTSTDRRPRTLPGLPVSETYSAIDSTGDRLGDRFAVLAGRLEIGGSAGGVGVADDRRHHRDLVGVDRADRRVQQRVDQSALAALELAHHGHVDRAVVDPLLSLVQGARKVGAVPGGGQLTTTTQAVDGLVDELVLARHLGGVAGRVALVGEHRRRGWCGLRHGWYGHCRRDRRRRCEQGRRGDGLLRGCRRHGLPKRHDRRRGGHRLLRLRDADGRLGVAGRTRCLGGGGRAARAAQLAPRPQSTPGSNCRTRRKPRRPRC